MPPVPDDLKDRKAGFGYFIDDAFLNEYHGEKGKRYSRFSKISIVRQIAEMARCLPIILSSYSGAAVVPCFATHNTNTQFDHRDPPAEKFNVFKRLLCIDEDPQWHELGVYIVCVPLCRIVHVAYMHTQRNVTIQNVFELCTISK